METIAIGSDHAGVELKSIIKKTLIQEGYNSKDYGTDSPDSVDYPDFAHPVASSIEKKEFLRGILICGSANGVAMAANKHENVRAAIAWTEELASLARLHNNANIICLPARFISEHSAIQIVKTFLNTEFEGGRHDRRVGKINC